MITIKYGGLSIQTDITPTKGIFCNLEDTARILTPQLYAKGVNDKDAFCKMWNEAKTANIDTCKGDNYNTLLYVVGKIQEDKDISFLIFTGVCLLMACDSLQLADYLENAFATGGDVVEIDDDTAKQWQILQNVKNIAKAEPDEPKQDTSTPAVQIAEITNPQNAVALDVYKIFGLSDASEKTIKIAEFVLLFFSPDLMALKKANPQLNATEKANLINDGYVFNSEECPPQTFTPKELAKALRPKDYEKNGYKKAVQRALSDFAPLEKISFSHIVKDETTGEMLERVERLFNIKYDWKIGTPDETKERFAVDPLQTIQEDSEIIEMLQNIVISPTIPAIPNQFINVADVDTYRRYMLAELSDDATRTARYLGVLGVPKISIDKVINDSTITAKRTQLSKKRFENSLQKALEITNAVYGKDWKKDTANKNLILQNPRRKKLNVAPPAPPAPDATPKRKRGRPRKSEKMQ